MEGLWELTGRGGKPKWKEEDIQFLTECLKNESRTYSSGQLAEKLEKERSLKRASGSIKTNTKKKGFIWKRNQRKFYLIAANNYSNSKTQIEV